MTIHNSFGEVNFIRNSYGSAVVNIGRIALIFGKTVWTHNDICDHYFIADGHVTIPINVSCNNNVIIFMINRISGYIIFNIVG